jgi:branched-chain amino acid transport system permease protein
MRSRIGRVLIAIRENEARTVMLGYHSFRYKLGSLALSGMMSAAAGAAYALLFSYVGSTFAGIQYSIFPLLWVLLGGQGTILGPLLGTGLMFYLIDVSSEYSSSYMLIVGVALVLLVLWFPKGILGTLRQKWLPWLP